MSRMCNVHIAGSRLLGDVVGKGKVFINDASKISDQICVRHRRQRRQSGLKSGEVVDPGQQNFEFSRKISEKFRFCKAISQNISIFQGKFFKNFDFPGRNCSFTATSGQIIQFLFKSHHFRIYFCGERRPSAVCSRVGVGSTLSPRLEPSESLPLPFNTCSLSCVTEPVRRGWKRAVWLREATLYNSVSELDSAGSTVAGWATS